MFSIVHAASGSVGTGIGLLTISSFLCRRYSQRKNEIKQMTRIVDNTAKIYTGTKMKTTIQFIGDQKIFNYLNNLEYHSFFLLLFHIFEYSFDEL